MRYKQRRDKRSVASLGENAVLLPETGLSYGAIAKHLDISKAYAVKLVQDHYAEMRRAAAGHIALTARQRRFARALLNGRSVEEAARFAARPGKLSPEEAHERADMTMSTENFRLAIRQIFRLEVAEANRSAAAYAVRSEAETNRAAARLCIPCANSRLPVASKHGEEKANLCGNG